MKNGDPSFILGIGNDIIEIQRIRESIANHSEKLLQRLFTSKEQEYCHKYKDPIPHFAARFSAKEAIVKAFGTGFGAHVAWQDLEILNDKEGKPSVYFSQVLEKRLHGTSVLLSMSHCDLYATAVAIWIKSI